MIAACAAVLAGATPSVWAAPVIIENVTNQPLTNSSTPATDFQYALGFNGGNTPQIFLIEINNPNAYDGNYRFYTYPAGGSPDSSSSWDYGDYLLKTEYAHYSGTSTNYGPPIIVDSITNFTVQQPLPGPTDSVIFGYLGPTGRTAFSPGQTPATYDLLDAYRVNLGGQSYAETLVGFFGEPAAASITLNLGATYVSTHAARLEGQQIVLQGSGVFGSNDTIYVAGNVTVTGGSLTAPTVIVDNDNAYLGQTPSVGAPTYGAAAPASTTLTLSGAMAKINTSALAVGDDSTNGPATLMLQNGATVATGIMFSGFAAKSEGIITVDSSTITTTSYVDIGVSGKSTLTIQNSGTVNVTGAGSNLGLANNTGSTAFLVADGPGSSLTTSGSIFVGGNGTNGSGGTATMTVSNDAIVTTKDALYVGNSGAAIDSLTISSGGEVLSSAASGNPSNFSGIVGSKIFTGTATATITGGASEWINKQSLAIGSGGTGTIMVTNGGTLEVDGITTEIGHYQGGAGTLTFDGAGGAAPFSPSTAPRAS